MKRIIAVLSVFIMLCSWLPVYAQATIEDAFSVDTATREFLSVAENDTVIRFYSGYFMYGFSQGWSLEKTLNDGWSHMLTEYLIVSEENGQEVISYKRVKDGEILQDSEEYSERKQKEFTEIYKLCKEPEKKLSVLGPFITVNKVVFLEALRLDGLYIYYETDVGDYVYFRRSLEAYEKEYLVPLEEFVEYAKEEQAIRSVAEGGGGGPELAATYLSDYDLSSYKITPRKLCFTVLFCAVPILLLVSVYFIVRRKKKT